MIKLYGYTKMFVGIAALFLMTYSLVFFRRVRSLAKRMHDFV